MAITHAHYRMLYEKQLARANRADDLASFIDWLDNARTNYFPRAWETIVRNLDAIFPSYAQHPRVQELLNKRPLAGRPKKPGNTRTTGSAAVPAAEASPAASSSVPVRVRPCSSTKPNKTPSITTQLISTKGNPSFEKRTPMNDEQLCAIGAAKTPPAPIDGLGYPIGFRPAVARQGITA